MQTILKVALHVFFLLAGALCTINSDLKVKGVIVFFRHGARAPMKSYQKLDNILKWTHPWKVLTKLGQRQHYLLGRLYRQKLVHEHGLLSPTYQPGQFITTSSFADRTIDSGNCFLLGLYNKGLAKMTDDQLAAERMEHDSPYKDELEGSSLPFDVPIIPIEVISNKNSLVNSLSECATIKQNEKKYYNSSVYNNILQKHNQTIIDICSKYGINSTKITRLEIKMLSEYLVSTKFHGLVELDDDLWSRFFDMNWEICYCRYIYLNISSRVSAYTFRKHVLPNIERIFAGDKKEPKVQFHFSHDDVIMSYVQGLSIPYNVSEPLLFASNMMFELLEDTSLSPNDTNYHKIRVLINFNVLQEAIPLNEFKKRIDIVANEIKIPIEEFCSVQTQKQGSSNYYVIGAAAASISILSVILIWYYIYPTKKKPEITQIKFYGISSSPQQTICLTNNLKITSK